MKDSETKAVIEWLVDGARPAPDTQGVLAELCERLLRCGIPLWRVGVFLLTLHPQIMGQRFLWKPGAAVDVNGAPFEAFQTDDFRNSPVRHAIDTGNVIRRRLRDEACPIDFTMLGELRGQGVTDYLAVPLYFADGVAHGATFATQDDRGFDEMQIATLKSAAAPLARAVENRSLRRTASALLDAYVGNKGGARILAGQIRRGDVETINAAIWLSDLRGFTTLTERLAPQTLLDLLNRYFDCQVPSILERGGEVLKFVGDGLVAIFPIAAHNEDAAQICSNALTAAREARAAVARLSRRLTARGVLPSVSATAAGPSPEPYAQGLRFGLALHVGQVSYGNIGSGNRLDFTCIGPAMNFAARLEGLTGKLRRTILASEEFAQRCPAAFVPLGQFEFAGIAGTRAAFGLPDELGQNGRQQLPA